MLLERYIDPSKDEIFYHYCSAQTFQSVCESKRLRFTDINMMNDSLEMRLGYSIFEEAASSFLENPVPALPDLDREFFDKVDEHVAPMQLSLHPVISCFSERPDMLGQWRAYGDDGRGFCIGFSAKALKKLPVTLLRVLYDRGKQVEEMRMALGALYMLNKSKGGDFGPAFRQACVLLAAEMASLKGDAFAEEKEVRCLHVLTVDHDKQLSRLVDIKDGENGSTVEGEEVKFRVRDGTICAFVDLPFLSEGDSDMIKEVILGPKNMNGPGNVLYLMGNNSLARPNLLHSKCSYR